jgi:tRNA G10  N-methylase Trm11
MVVGDFRKLPFREGVFDTVVFDPPYVCYLSDSQMGVSQSFGGFKGWEEAVRSLYFRLSRDQEGHGS